jgi:hypothetical protein
MATAPNSRTPRVREAELRARFEEKQADLERFRHALDALRTVQDVPFVWDIAFVEIFEGDSGGFDIVIGNPPYVRQEMIVPPMLDPRDFGGENSSRWKEQKKAYKEKLQRSVAAAWPRFFQYKPGSDTFRKPDGKATSTSTSTSTPSRSSTRRGASASSPPTPGSMWATGLTCRSSAQAQPREAHFR